MAAEEAKDPVNRALPNAERPDKSSVDICTPRFTRVAPGFDEHPDDVLSFLPALFANTDRVESVRLCLLARVWPSTICQTGDTGGAAGPE